MKAQGDENVVLALAGVAQLAGASSCNREVVRWIQVRALTRIAGPVPDLGTHWRQPTGASLSHRISVLPSLPSSHCKGYEKRCPSVRIRKKNALRICCFLSAFSSK